MNDDNYNGGYEDDWNGGYEDGDEQGYQDDGYYDDGVEDDRGNEGQVEVGIEVRVEVEDGYPDEGGYDDHHGGEDDQGGHGYHDGEGDGYDGEPPNEADPRHFDYRYTQDQDGEWVHNEGGHDDKNERHGQQDDVGVERDSNQGGYRSDRQMYDDQDPNPDGYDDRYQHQHENGQDEGLYVPPQCRDSVYSGNGSGCQQGDLDEEYQRAGDEYDEDVDPQQHCEDTQGYDEEFDDQFNDQGDDDRSVESGSSNNRPQGSRSSYAEFGGSTTVIDDSDQYPLSTYKPYHVRQQMYRDREASMRRSRQQRGGRRRTNTEEESKQSSSGSDTQSSLEHRRRES